MQQPSAAGAYLALAPTRRTHRTRVHTAVHLAALASMHPLTRDLLRRRFIWRQLLERIKMTQERLLACKSLEEYCDTMLDMGKEAEAIKSLLDVLDPDEDSGC